MSDLFTFAANMSELEAPTGLKGSLPPVDKWNPEYCGEIDIRIGADGVWYHEGTPISRPKLVRLFSTILKREGEEYFLVTPVEKLKISVEDVPFQAVRLNVEAKGTDSQKLIFTTNMGEEVTAGPGHALHFAPSSKGSASSADLIPYIEVRRGLNARLSRPVYYQLAELVSPGSDGVFSNGEFYPFSA